MLCSVPPEIVTKPFGLIAYTLTPMQGTVR